MNIIEGAEAKKHDAHAIGIRPEHIDVTETGGRGRARLPWPSIWVRTRSFMSTVLGWLKR